MSLAASACADAGSSSATAPSKKPRTDSAAEAEVCATSSCDAGVAPDASPTPFARDAAHDSAAAPGATATPPPAPIPTRSPALTEVGDTAAGTTGDAAAPPLDRLDGELDAAIDDAAAAPSDGLDGELDAAIDDAAPVHAQPTPALRAGPMTLAAGGVARLRVDHLEPEDLLGVEVGGERLDPREADAVQWLTADEQHAADLAVRAPSTLATGSNQLTLITRHGNFEWSFDGVEPAGAYPPSPSGIIGISPAASGVFPISTISAGGVVSDTDGGATLGFDFEYRLYLRSAGRDDCPFARAGKGEIYGEEIARALQVSHPVFGEYELHSTANRARVSIDRTSSGGLVEDYTGGWVRYPGADTTDPAVPPPDQRATPAPLIAGGALLLLTSERTGRQLLIDRDLDDEEERNRMRGCMMELP